MYPNLKGELAKGGFKLEPIASYLGITISTLSQKLNGKYRLTLEEAVKIKKFIGSKLPLEVLFAEEAV